MTGAGAGVLMTGAGAGVLVTGAGAGVLMTGAGAGAGAGPPSHADQELKDANTAAFDIKFSGLQTICPFAIGPAAVFPEGQDPELIAVAPDWSDTNERFAASDRQLTFDVTFE